MSQPWPPKPSPPRNSSTRSRPGRCSTSSTPSSSWRRSSASRPPPRSPPPPPPAAAAEAAPAEEQTEFTVVLTAIGDAKINVIKAVREITGLGLKEAKDLVDAAPKPVREAVPREEADQVKAKLEEAGATAEIR